MNTFKKQIRDHSVALISLAIALSSLAYNTWRNERTEANRNIRTAGIELLLKLGELDKVVFFSHYDKDNDRGNPRSGWAYVLTIRDLAALTSEPAISSSVELFATWNERWPNLGTDDESANLISARIDQLRDDVREVIAELD